MRIYVVSAQFAAYDWMVVKAFLVEEDALAYAEKIYEDGFFGSQMILDSRVDEVYLED